MPKVRWLMSYGFCSKFHTLSSSAKMLKILSDLTKLQRVQRWELYLRHSVVIFTFILYYWSNTKANSRGTRIPPAAHTAPSVVSTTAQRLVTLTSICNTAAAQWVTSDRFPPEQNTELLQTSSTEAAGVSYKQRRGHSVMHTLTSSSSQ